MDLSTNSHKKLQLKQFLLQNLDDAPAPRVIEWVNRPNGIFRVLWLHQSSSSFTDSDAALFRYWALARGKSPNIPKVELKQNFRMALNKSPCVEALPEETQCHEYRYFKFKGWPCDENTTSSTHSYENYFAENSPELLPLGSDMNFSNQRSDLDSTSLFNSCPGRLSKPNPLNSMSNPSHAKKKSKSRKLFRPFSIDDTECDSSSEDVAWKQEEPMYNPHYDRHVPSSVDASPTLSCSSLTPMDSTYPNDDLKPTFLDHGYPTESSPPRFASHYQDYAQFNYLNSLHQEKLKTDQNYLQSDLYQGYSDQRKPSSYSLQSEMHPAYSNRGKQDFVSLQSSLYQGYPGLPISNNAELDRYSDKLGSLHPEYSQQLDEFSKLNLYQRHDSLATLQNHRLLSYSHNQ